MPQVPQLTEQKVQEQGYSNARVSTEAPIEAFGGGQSQAGVFDAGTSLIKQMKENADDAVTTDYYAKLTQKKNELMYDPQNGVMTQKGEAGLGVQEKYAPQLSDYADQLEANMTGEQKRMAMKIRSNITTDFNDQLEKHTFQESENLQDEKFKSGLSAAKDNAILNYGDSNEVQKSLNIQEGLIRQNGQRKGLSQDVVDQQINNIKSSTQSAIIDRMLANGQTEAAKDYYDKNKASFAGEDVTRLDKEIDKATTLDQSMQAWNQVKGIRLADGMPNEEAMVNKVMSRDDLSNEKKEKISDFIRSKATEMKRNITMQDNARDRGFMNALTTMREQNTPIEEALRTVGDYSKDDFDRSLKEDAVRKVYAPPTKDDPIATLALWERVRDGVATQDEIDNAWKSGKTSVTTWMSFRHDLHDQIINGPPPGDVKLAIDDAKLAISEKGLSKDEQRAYLLQLREKTQGKSADQIRAISQDMLKTAAGTDHNFFGFSFGGDPQWKVDREKSQAENVARGAAEIDLGQIQTRAIMGGFFKDPSKQNLTGIDAFSKEFGGYDQIKLGTPVNNAVQSLAKRGKPATVNNVKAVLKTYPDGNY